MKIDPVSIADQPDNQDAAMGTRLRDARKRKSLTLKDLAEKLGVSIGLLSQIERGQSSPSVRILRSLCHELGIDGATLFHGDEKIWAKDSDVVVRRGTRRKIRFTSQNVTKFKLTPDDPGSLEAYLIDLLPGGKSSDEFYSHPGQEFGFVLEGRMEVFVDDRTLLIDAGDSIRFNSTSMHKWRNGWDGRTVVVWVVSSAFYV